MYHYLKIYWAVYETKQTKQELLYSNIMLIVKLNMNLND